MSEEPESVEALLQYLKGSRGFDFTAYKRSSLIRRIQKRQQAVAAPTFTAYQAYLESHPEEFPLLFNTILINVTSFFRDPDAWRYVASEIVPRILAATRPDGAIRLWGTNGSPGALLRGHDGLIHELSWSTNGRWVASAGEDSTVKVWDSNTGKLIHSFRGHTGLVNSLAFTLDGQRLVTGSRDGKLKFWDVAQLGDARDSSSK